MASRNLAQHGWMAALAAWACLISWAAAQDYGSPQGANRPHSRVYRAAGQPQARPTRRAGAGQPRAPYQLAERSAALSALTASRQGAGQPKEHPLAPAIRWARDGVHNIRQIQDYSAVMVKRERVDGKLLDEQYMFLKVRHRPLSVYLYFLKPDSLHGQEVIWIENQNDGKMWAHGTGMKSIFGTVSLNPTSPIAMDGNRYPITEIGILNLVQRLLEVAQQDAQYGECEVKFFRGAKVDDRVCTLLQVTHPVPRRNFRFHVARVFIDDELNVPIRYEAYDWPSKPGAAPPLMEQYTYRNLRLNNGFTDADFDIRNPQYGF
jgi:hypothetical protein